MTHADPRRSFPGAGTRPPSVPPRGADLPGRDADYTDEVIAKNQETGVAGEPAGSGRNEQKVEITDPKAIRALAHAARLEVISELYATQVSHTATELAARTGLTPSAMSYHLRAPRSGGSLFRPRTQATPANVGGRRQGRTSPFPAAASPARRSRLSIWNSMRSGGGRPLLPRPEANGGNAVRLRRNRHRCSCPATCCI